MKEFIRILGSPMINTTLVKYQNESKDASNFTQINEIEKNTTLYNEDDLFFHTPQLKFNIKELQVRIDAPPEEIKGDEMPAFLTYGASIMMGATSIITSISSINSLVKKTATFDQVWPSLAISLAMIVGSMLFPIISNKIQKNNIKKRELKRKTKYQKYLDDKKTMIQNVINEQSTILNNNFISLEDIIANLKSNSLKIWNKEISDIDFLTVRLGLGNRNAEIKIDAPGEEFSMDDDNLKQAAIELANTPMMLKNVPITVSLIENNVFPLILECTNKKGFIDGIILQLIANHSPNDLKLVFFLDKNSEYEYEYAKYLIHTLSSDKNKRFFATTEDEMKDISQYLETEYNNRKAQKNNIDADEQVDMHNSKEYYKNNSPYYLIITNSFKLAKDQGIINKILETNSNYGFSLLLLESNLKNLPSKCDRFAKIMDNNSGLFGKDLSSKDQSTYKADYLTNANMSDLVSIISNIPISGSSSENTLPKLIEFLEMYNVGKIEQLNILNKWETSNSTNSLAAPIGVYKSGNKFDLDLHEKIHGPHGLIAGMTGSGKSEFIITYILSMAVNYHPDDVQFVLIDYKGGGLAGAFENRETGVVLPHVIGTITNLDTNEMNRSLVSIKSELKRRQKIFNEVRERTGESTIDIYKYQRLYKEGVINEPISHLFIISDEFAELKANQPEFMDELISTARIGRSLGVHLILATQKPSGVVNDQIRSNSKFSICLKVADKSDSTDMIDRPDAAFLKQSGAFYLLVGNGEYFTLGQSAYSGAKYTPSDVIISKVDKSIEILDGVGQTKLNLDVEAEGNNTQSEAHGEELLNVITYLSNLAKEEKIQTKRLWLERIPDVINTEDIKKKYNYQNIQIILYIQLVS